MSSSCLFCDIIAGKLPGTIIYRDDRVTAFNDRFPKAPVHILIVPNRHIVSVEGLQSSDIDLAGYLFLIAQKLARETGIAEGGYRLVVNTGPNAGQSVHHLHVHLLGGNSMPLMGG